MLFLLILTPKFAAAEEFTRSPFLVAPEGMNGMIYVKDYELNADRSWANLTLEFYNIVPIIVETEYYNRNNPQTETFETLVMDKHEIFVGLSTTNDERLFRFKNYYTGEVIFEFTFNIDGTYNLLKNVDEKYKYGEFYGIVPQVNDIYTGNKYWTVNDEYGVLQFVTINLKAKQFSYNMFSDYHMEDRIIDVGTFPNQRSIYSSIPDFYILENKSILAMEDFYLNDFIIKPYVEVIFNYSEALDSFGYKTFAKLTINKDGTIEYAPLKEDPYKKGLNIFEQAEKEASETVTPFKDTIGEFGEEYIHILNKAGFINGKTPTTFAPYDQVTYRQFLLMIGRIFNYEKVENTFDSLPDEDGKVITLLYKGNFLDDDFNESLLNKPIPREKAAVYLGKVLEYINDDYAIFFNPNEWENLYKDHQQIKDLKTGYYVYLHQHYGVMSGSNNMFRPKEGLTRMQAAKIIYLGYQKAFDMRMKEFYKVY